MVASQINQSKREEKMWHNAAWTTGRITEYQRGNKGSGGSVYYHFNINGHKYENRSGAGHLSRDEGNVLIGKSFAVIYDSTDPESSAMILYQSQSEDFRFKYPDSFKIYTLLK